MILIFDLDDTLYDEMSFVTSGFSAVARYGQVTFGWDAEQSLDFMKKTLARYGRGSVFDKWLSEHGRHSRTLAAECVRIYRHHQPEIALAPGAISVLEHYHGRWPIYIVTDGHKMVQQKKIDALKIKPYFKNIFITHRFGIRHAKPSLHCFEIIRIKEGSKWEEMVYVGDNPSKDFVNLNAVGAMTIRVNTGSYASVKAKKGYDASFKIADISHLPMLLERWER